LAKYRAHVQDFPRARILGTIDIFLPPQNMSAGAKYRA
jgi:hypothetical protein